MKNAEENAFPFRSVSVSETEDNHYGLTKREYYAAKAMQAILSTPDPNKRYHLDLGFVDVRAVAVASVELADELLKALENG